MCSPATWGRGQGKDTHRETLLHELSHLHFQQKLGWLRRTKGVPSWFQEGLADWVADTGDEQVSTREARDALLSGHCLVSETSVRLPIPKRPHDYGLTWPMFHMQSRMFVEYLRSRDEDTFQEFVAAVVRGNRFETAFREDFRASLSDSWGDFLDSLQPEQQNDRGIEVCSSAEPSSQCLRVRAAVAFDVPFSHPFRETAFVSDFLRRLAGVGRPHRCVQPPLACARRCQRGG